MSDIVLAFLKSAEVLTFDMPLWPADEKGTSLILYPADTKIFKLNFGYSDQFLE